MKHCNRCSHPTICDTHGCAAEEARTNHARRSTQDFDFEQHLARQRAFSERTFGPGMRTQGVVDHIRKELLEILANPEDLSEWIDVAILALDGAWRTGATPEQIIAALVAKQDKNERRQWPDWRTVPADQAIEHDRGQDATALLAEEEEDGDEWESRGKLARLKCWHRLSEDEANDLIAFFSDKPGGEAVATYMRVTEFGRTHDRPVLHNDVPIPDLGTLLYTHPQPQPDPPIREFLELSRRLQHAAGRATDPSHATLLSQASKALALAASKESTR